MTQSPARRRPAALQSDVPHIVIIGGGITGMSAAYYLQRAARSSGTAVSYTLVERDTRLGGKIITERVTSADGGEFLVEGGPDSFVAQKPWAIELARELGLGDALMPSNHLPRTTCVLHRGRPLPLPEGTMLIVPTRFTPFALSPLISPLGKLRMALDLLIPPRTDAADESLADFIRRRLGHEALDKLAEPLMAGIHSADAERQSVMATFGRFRDMERAHGGLIRGMIAARRKTNGQGAMPPAGAAPQTTGRASLAGSPFVTLRGGVQTLVDALTPRLEGELISGCGVRELRYDQTAERPYRMRLDDGTVLEADAVVLAAPAFVAADLVAPFQPELAAGLREIRYVSTGTITLAYRRDEISQPLDGYGVVIPRREQRRINALTISSAKFSHRAPDSHVLVRVFIGGSRTPEALEQHDAELVAMARAELAEILGISATPLFTRVYRWESANPQYDVGHLERMAAIAALCPPGLHLAGGAYGGVGIPDCVRQGREAAEQALALVMSQTAA